MILVTIASWFITFIILATNREKATLWASSIAFLCGLGGFAITIQDYIIPFLKNIYNISSDTATCLYVLITVLSGIVHYFGPWTILMFGVASAGILPAKWELRIAIIALLPELITWLFFPTHNYYMTTSAEKIEYFKILSLWAVPYITAGNGLLLYSYFKEKNVKLKRRKLIVCIFSIPFFNCAMVTDYIARAIGLDQVWRYNTGIILLLLICFLYFTYNYGVLGIRLKFEKERLDSAMQVMSSGTAILNHSIKNEVIKISMCAKNIRKSVNNSNSEEIDENIQTVLDATEHLSAMMKRIQDQMKDIVLIESPVDLAEIINKSLEMQKIHLDSKEVFVSRNYGSGFILKCDPVHITEVINNILKNAVEATASEIEIAVYPYKKGIILEIKDDGMGISKENMKHVFEPFFSTKKLTMNFGLGMSYAYNVMQHHKGQLEINSTEKEGTIVSLIFPQDKGLTAE